MTETCMRHLDASTQSTAESSEDVSVRPSSELDTCGSKHDCCRMKALSVCSSICGRLISTPQCFFGSPHPARRILRLRSNVLPSTSGRCPLEERSESCDVRKCCIFPGAEHAGDPTPPKPQTATLCQTNIDPQKGTVL